ncbi:MAG: hypothetical protein GY927_04010 [bacterium]|nr:hypothetical protein [bacterium]
MDGLKRSLEEAIKKMQDIPAATQLSMRSHADLRLARAADTLQTMHPMPEPTPTNGAAHEAQSPSEFIPTADSIEAALSSAPAVSPHYVAPEPVTVPPEVPVAPVRVSIKNMPSTQEPSPKRRALRFGTPKTARPAPVRPAMKISSTFPNAQSNMSAPARHYEPTASGGFDLGNIENEAADLAFKTKKLRDNIWRWATIGISCAVGLASGWLGSNFSDLASGVSQNSVQTIAGRASDGVSITRPENIKIVPEGAAKFISGTAVGRLPINMTGKSDRAVPLDENLCTVLELDRGTGLTLARPCKMIETAGFNATLGKSDLLAKSK